MNPMPVRASLQESRVRRRLRWAGRWGVLAAALALAWPNRDGSWTSVLLPALSPYVAAGAALGARGAGLLASLALPVVVLALIYRRWFCRHACPAGLLQELVERLRPSARMRWRRVPKIGEWLVILTLGGACLGYPFFLWLDPLAVFHGFVNAWRHPLALANLLGTLGLLTLLALALFQPQLWCQKVCPLGATQEWLARPRRWLRRRRSSDAGQSPGLSRLVPSALDRRRFLAAGLGAAAAMGVRTAHGRLPPPVRPPGATEEDRFVGLCVRCGNCAQACPTRIIRPDLGGSGVAGFFTPRLRFESDYCREDCHQCNRVCPSGAIARLSLEEKRRRIIGLARVDMAMCLLANGRECTACIRECPYRAIVLVSSDGGFSNQPGVSTAKCTGCGACEVVCPVRPHRAIRVQTGDQVLA